MKNEQLYNKTVDILVQAYFDNTLVHGNQCGCAVGNIVASNMGIKIFKGRRGQVFWSKEAKIWKDAAWYGYITHASPQEKEFEYSISKAKNQIKKTGYSFSEIGQIEGAFERADFGASEEDFMFNGLMAVIDVLDEIHENKDTNVSQTTKNKFHRTTINQ